MSPRRFALFLPVILTAAGTPSNAGAEPLLETTRLELTTGDRAGQPSVAVDPREGFVLTWQERDGDTASLWYAVLDRDGRELRRARIASGASWFVNWADFPSLAVLENGDWVTHYLVESGGSPHAYDIQIVRSTDRERTWSAPVSPHTDGTPTQHGFVSLTPAGGDHVLVVWLDGRLGAASDDAAHGDHHEEEGPMSLRSTILDREGRRAEERMLDDSTCSCCQTDAVRLGNRTLVAYRDRSPEEIRDIAVLARDAEGEWSAPRTLHADGWRIEACPVNGPALAASRDRFLAVWPTLASGTYEVRYTLGTAEAAGKAHTLAGGDGVLGRVDAAPLRDDFLVSWLDGDSTAARVRLARIDVSGRIVARATIEAPSSVRMFGVPRLASLGDRALLAWAEPRRDGAGSGIAIALVR